MESYAADSLVISGSDNSDNDADIIDATRESDVLQHVLETSEDDRNSLSSASVMSAVKTSRLNAFDADLLQSEDESFVATTKTWRSKKTHRLIDSDSDAESNHSDPIAVISSDSDIEEEKISKQVKPVEKKEEEIFNLTETSSENKNKHDTFNSESDLDSEDDGSFSKVEEQSTAFADKAENGLTVEEKSESSSEYEDSRDSSASSAKESLEIVEEKPSASKAYPLTKGMDKIKADKENITDNILPEILVTQAEYMQQSEKVNLFRTKWRNLKSSLATVDYNKLQDNGKSLLDREKQMRKLLEDETNKLERMKISDVPKPKQLASAVPTWEQLQRDAILVQPDTFGTRALNTVDTQREMTMDVLRNLHKSLEERPAPEVLADTPLQCKVELMPHQRHALAFMTWRESNKPSGGLLADDMGLGKTLTVICLCLNTLAETRKAQASKEWKAKGRSIRPAGVLIVCPASVMSQWVKEVKQRLRKNTLDVLEYHGNNRHQDTRLLHRVDMVLTTFATLSREHINNTQLFNLKWRRVVLDEAHQVRNYKTQSSAAVCALRAESRWALTGTPIHNEQLDMYGIMKYLHCEPFDDLVVWKRWVSNKRTGGDQRLNSALQALMLRRTKAEMIESGALCTFPERTHKTIQVTLERDERLVYSKIMVFSKTLFTRFLQQRAEKQGLYDPETGYKNKAFDKFRTAVIKISKGDVKQSDILTLLLRLRQICIHPTLITKMLETTDLEAVDAEEGELDDKDDMLNLLDKLDQLKLDENNTDAQALEDYGLQDEDVAGAGAGVAAPEKMSLNDAVKSVYKKEHPVFDPNRMSSKIRVCFDLLKKNIFPTGDKAIIVSQWTSLLKLIANHLKEEGITFCSLDGSVKIPDRQGLIDQLNNANNSCKIMLLSLTAGGVGLNLIGANHLIILDPHWNPQLESQAQDRIYRMGQKKLVHIYRLIVTDSIEQGIVELQTKKLEIAHSMLTGTTIAGGNKLTLNDLKMLFNM